PMQNLPTRPTPLALVQKRNFREIIEARIVARVEQGDARTISGLAGADRWCVRDTDRPENFFMQHIPGVGTRSAHGLQETLDRRSQQEEVLVPIADHGTRLPRVRPQVFGDTCELLLIGWRRVPRVVVASKITIVDVVRVGLE